ncbi:MAG TPA: hypothetical protein VG186_06860 [Solirubrobacteraceae bacterium]|nr:hypothetical protein [Solirubrobacteraceae bacterium]
MSRTCVCSIVSDGYRANGEVLAHSVRDHNPDYDVLVLNLDSDGILALGLDGPERLRLAAMYCASELAGALKPHLIRHLLDAGADTVILLDADVEVFAPLDLSVALAAQHGVVLTPHMTTPDERFEPWFLRSGMFNAGFIAVNGRSRAFLDWWAARTARHSHYAPEDGYFNEQRWLDLAPSLFGAHVLRDSSYNVMGWNLHERQVPPVTFFHFCGGFDPHRPDKLATMPGLPWPSLDEYPAVAAICRAYAAKLLDSGYDRAKQSPYRYGVAPGGLTIEPRMRRLYREAVLEAEATGGEEPPNPFVDGTRFVDWLLEPVDDTGLTRYLLGVHIERFDLRIAFPDVPGRHSAAFMDWLVGEPANRETIPRLFLPAAAL